MMNALKKTVFPCYAEADFPFARELAAFLERGADVHIFLEDGAITPGTDLIGKARDGRLADIVLVLLSPDSVPSKWVRSEWEEAFLKGPAAEGVRIAFLLIAECGFPEVLRRQAFFRNRRALKRWIRSCAQSVQSPPARLEALTAALADQPGIVTSELASEFVQYCGADFDAVFWLRCGARSLAELAGDLGCQLDLRLDSEPLANAARIRAFARIAAF